MNKVEEAARLEFARYVYRNCKREPEGTFNGDTGKFEPTSREGLHDTTPKVPKHFKGWAHTYWLCMAALDGKDVPPDIVKARDEHWGRIHLKHYAKAKTAQLKAESAAFEKAQRAQAKKQAKAEGKSRVARIAKAEATIKRYDTKIKRLTTLRKKAVRSLKALQRAEQKGKTS